MEDTKSLLIMVLHKIFHDRPSLVEDTYKLIYNYNNGKREKNEYEKTLKNICDLMNDELPSEILVYLLTLVDMPQKDGNALPIMEKIQKTYSCLAESVRPCLVEYLEKRNKSHDKVSATMNKDDRAVINSDKLSDPRSRRETSETIIEPQSSTSMEESEEKFLKPIRKRNRNRRKMSRNNNSDSSDDNVGSMKTLLDITANYVIKHERNLKIMYKSKLNETWKMINSNTCSAETLKQCYRTVNDLNKKVKLLRCIENDNITEDLLTEEYGYAELPYQGCNEPEKDPFMITDEFLDGMKNFLSQ